MLVSIFERLHKHKWNDWKHFINIYIKEKFEYGILRTDTFPKKRFQYLLGDIPLRICHNASIHAFKTKLAEKTILKYNFSW